MNSQRPAPDIGICGRTFCSHGRLAHCRGMPVYLLTNGRNGEAPSIPVQELHSKAPFQCLDTAAQQGSRSPQVLGGY